MVAIQTVNGHSVNILIVKLSSLGDVIQTMPVVNDLLRQFPEAQVDWVVEESFAPLVHRVPGLRRVLPLAQRRWRKTRWSENTRRERKQFTQTLQEHSYDAVIDFQGLIKSALEARDARLNPGGFSATYGNASEACGYEWPVQLLLQRKLPMPQRIHAVARYRLLAGLALGYEPAGQPLYSLPTAAVQAKNSQVVFAHGTTRADNEWPESKWVQLGKRLTAQGARIGLPQCNTVELERVTRIAQAIGERAEVWPSTGLADVMNRMTFASGVIGVDSGLSHMAVALNLPHVQIFSQPRAWRAGPVGQRHQVAVGGEKAPDVQAVWEAWQTVLQSMPQAAFCIK
jgi:heptosyltransferase-1